MPFVVLSAEVSKLPQELNVRRTDHLKTTLDELLPDYTPVIGSYKGKTEKSFLVRIHDEDEYEQARYIAKEASQESILLVDDDLVAHLVYLDSGDIVPVGIWTLVSFETPPDLDAWTCLEGFYFSTV